MISEQIIREYIHIPKLTQVLISGRKYYNFGLRIKTELPVEYFVERWNYIKYKNREGYQLLQSTTMREAEMQM